MMRVILFRLSGRWFPKEQREGSSRCWRGGASGEPAVRRVSRMGSRTHRTDDLPPGCGSLAMPHAEAVLAFCLVPAGSKACRPLKQRSSRPRSSTQRAEHRKIEGLTTERAVAREALRSSSWFECLSVRAGPSRIRRGGACRQSAGADVADTGVAAAPIPIAVSSRGCVTWPAGGTSRSANCWTEGFCLASATKDTWSVPVCDYSLHAVHSRPAKAGELLITSRGTGNRCVPLTRYRARFQGGCRLQSSVCDAFPKNAVRWHWGTARPFPKSGAARDRYPP